MAKFTVADAERIAAKPKPWTIRLECHTGGCNKYWYATGRALHEAVECGWGAIGAIPQLKLITWTELRAKVIEKLGKGYLYADTPFVRMSPGSLAQLGSQTPAVVVAPPVITVGTTVAPGVTVKSITVTPAPPQQVLPQQVPASLVALGAPYDMIVKLKMVRTGVKVTGYAAVDVNGGTVMEFSKDGGPDFATQHGLDIDFI